MNIYEEIARMLREGSAALSPPSPVFTVVPTEIQGAATSPAGNRRMPFELFFRRLQLVHHSVEYPEPFGPTMEMEWRGRRGSNPRPPT